MTKEGEPGSSLKYEILQFYVFLIAIDEEKSAEVKFTLYILEKFRK